jgi:hypothetical protein
MHRRLLVAVVAVLGASAGLVATANSASASPIPLVVSQGSAFAVLGHSCGGIQEKAYVSGFAAVTGYPVGDVYLSTRCGGSGRGGGYHVTTYSAWVNTAWDFTGALVSDVVVTGAVSVDPTFSALDSHGNEIYNQSNSAFLVLAAGFIPPPRVATVSPTSAPGKTVVTLTGTGFVSTKYIFFGPYAAHFTVLNDSTATATAPAAGTGTVNVRVINSGGISPKVATDQFTFTLAPNVTGLAPNQGSADGGTSVTITGLNFNGATAVRFGGVDAAFVVDSQTTITAIAPAGPDSGVTVDVTVTTPQGTSAIRTADQFGYL